MLIQFKRQQNRLEPLNLTPHKPQSINNITEQTNSSFVEEILKELNELIGLEKVKYIFHEIYAFARIQKKRQKEKLYNEPMVLHMVFKGNPGTGKTTVARIAGKLFRELGLLQKGHLIEIERADLVGEYIGHTAIKTREQIKRALGGILFIDEAYSLARGGEKDFGKEAIDTMVKAMEDHKDNLVIILAGYPSEMEWFLRTNPGLRSRFPIHISFPDYSIDELMLIAEQMLKQRQYDFTPQAKERFKEQLKNLPPTTIVNGNARLVRNYIEKLIRCQAVRLVKKEIVTRDDLILITEDDIYSATGNYL
ncbi:MULTISPECIES: AAA family ATPase [Carboxydocella]|uniref:Stage V sporulation protein K n=2 Tax=Carboxydocella TaxID=178898 RepID=A0A1T4LWN0_9FIRM|nr:MULTISPECIES: AAA family ATPase [Carboxydocella]AVX20640.1 stage V sporulation protein K [Carboxydocella thermautotrophica]AVX31062.1 stage V sporulation protein K [Carboxydocella thermautotrophica]GAW32194.1 stage V sporulation protein K [Carboxydocella sp. JDF658]SJZ58844.1 stage V sporulation protein K [Carboxydocella sporoproducens DSM 16521]